VGNELIDIILTLPGSKLKKILLIYQTLASTDIYFPDEVFGTFAIPRQFLQRLFIVKKNISNIALLATIMTSSAAFAAGQSVPGQNASGPFIGAGVGVSVGDRVDAPTNGQASSDKAAYNLYGGYNINENFGVKLGYRNFGKATVSDSGDWGTSITTTRTSGFSLSAVGTYPVTPDWALIGEAGVMRYKVKRGGGSSDSKGDKFFGALGVKYSVAKSVDLIADYTRYGKVGLGNNADSKLNLDTLGLNLQYRF
jgi:OmpA-OmpF porin, OOP family